VDPSPEKITRARESFRGVVHLKFETMDVRRSMAFERPFDALIDHGCLVDLPAAERTAYVANMAAATRPGARYLLLMPVAGGKQEIQQFARSVRGLFNASFELMDAQITPYPRPENGAAIQGIAFRFLRR
jgi:hypothetical protein